VLLQRGSILSSSPAAASIGARERSRTLRRGESPFRACSNQAGWSTPRIKKYDGASSGLKRISKSDVQIFGGEIEWTRRVRVRFSAHQPSALHRTGDDGLRGSHWI
jgi:hypothetical protein